MKLTYSNWHKELVHDDSIRAELNIITNGKLEFDSTPYVKHFRVQEGRDNRTPGYGENRFKRNNNNNNSNNASPFQRNNRDSGTGGVGGNRDNGNRDTRNAGTGGVRDSRNPPNNNGGRDNSNRNNKFGGNKKRYL